jgi:hypothetical protein
VSVTDEPRLFPVDDPYPSVEELRLRNQQTDVLLALLDAHSRFPVGANAFELQAHMLRVDPGCRIERNAIASRFAELADMGLVELLEPRQAPTGKPEKVWGPTPRAFEWRKRTREAA